MDFITPPNLIVIRFLIYCQKIKKPNPSLTHIITLSTTFISNRCLIYEVGLPHVRGEAAQLLVGGEVAPGHRVFAHLALLEHLRVLVHLTIRIHFEN